MNQYKSALSVLLILFFGIPLAAQEGAPGQIPEYPVSYEYPTVDGIKDVLNRGRGYYESTSPLDIIDYTHNSTYHFRLKSEWPEEQQQLAFPTAEEYGKYAKGGRDGVVYEVTTLNDSGEGSLRAAVEASGPRTVVSRVSGNIELECPIKITNPYIAIAGQTAPGGGICLKNHPLNIDANHAIVRYIRLRPGDVSGNDYDAVGGGKQSGQRKSG